MERFVHQRLRAMAMEEDGISLIEMLAAILILGIALAAFASSMVSSLQAVSRDQRMVVANALATEVIEDLQGLAWQDAALYADEVTGAFGGTTFEGEDLVLRSDDRPDMSCQPVPCPVRTVDRDGVEYEIRTAITWVDDDEDNDASGDDDTGDSEDYKRFTVDLSWTLRDTQRDHRVVALRAAESRERPIRVEVEDADGDDDVDLNGDACNSESFTLSAETLEPAEDSLDSVIVKYTSRYGSEATVELTHAGDYRTWSKSMAIDTSEDGDCSHEKFPDGPVLFTFEAVDRATGMELWRETEILEFVRPLTIGPIQVTPSVVEVDEVGDTCDAVTVTVDVDGGTTDGTVTFTWTESTPASHELESSDDETSATLTDAGATFEHTYPAGTPFGSPGSSKTLTVDVDPRLDRPTVSGTSDPVEVVLSQGCVS